MNKFFESIKEKHLDWSMIRWIVVGFGTTGVDYLIFITLFGPINSVVVANFISGLFSTSINYFTHHKWTFKSQQEHSRSGSRFLLNLVFWWTVSTFLIKTLIVLGIDPKLAKLIPILIIAPINYFVLNHLVFKKN